jgi:hypothetical protein
MLAIGRRFIIFHLIGRNAYPVAARLAAVGEVGPARQLQPQRDVSVREVGRKRDDVGQVVAGTGGAVAAGQVHCAATSCDDL